MEQARYNGSTFSSYVSRIPKIQWLLLIIPIAYILLLLMNPVFNFFKLGFFDENGFTFEYIIRVLTQTSYLKVIGVTLLISFLVTVVSLIFGYPVAYLMARTESALWKRIILFSVLIPFWISLLIRTFSWMLILSDQGVINSILMGLGIIYEPITLLFTTFSVVIGMTHVLIAYMILSLHSIMEGIDNRLMDAARSMGASPTKAFLHVFLPLSLPGILVGSILVFVQGIAFFVTPAILGGRGDITMSVLIRDFMTVSLNWNVAAALAIVMFLLVLLLLFLSALILRKNPLLKDVI